MQTGFDWSFVHTVALDTSILGFFTMSQPGAAFWKMVDYTGQR